MRIALFAVLLCAIGCASAYDSAYEQETQRLEQEEQQLEQERQAEAEAAHAEAEAALAEARRYAAVVYFDVNSAVIKEEGYRELLWFVRQMQPHPEVTIQVQGFADSTGQVSSNQKLSEERTASVAAEGGSAGLMACWLEGTPCWKVIVAGWEEISTRIIHEIGVCRLG
jgi:outer membrane protein OmpA-like peptidoglycan-associated protein